MSHVLACLSKQGLTNTLNEILLDSLVSLTYNGNESVQYQRDEQGFIGSTKFVEEYGSYFLALDGRIYNPDEHTTPLMSGKNNADCIRYLINQFDGEFAGILYDPINRTMHVFRDTLGVKPMFYGIDVNDRMYFSSKAKGLFSHCAFIDQVRPGFLLSAKCEEYFISTTYVPYGVAHAKLRLMPKSLSREFFVNNIREIINDAIIKRVTQSMHQSICLFLSGGINSSIIAACLVKEFKVRGLGPLNTFCIGTEGSNDLEQARILSEYLGTRHHSIICSKDDVMKAIPNAIKCIESYDVDMVKSSVLMYLLSRQIAKKTEFKQVFLGDYADDVMSGYSQFENVSDPTEFYESTLSILDNAHYYNGNRCLSHFGLEIMAPFADNVFREFYLRIPINLRMPLHNHNIEKFLVRLSFSNMLPPAILWRKKESFIESPIWGQILPGNSTEYFKSIFVEQSPDVSHHICDAIVPSRQCMNC